MNKVLHKMPDLVAEELAAANEVFPPFRSLHEGWAVLKEEVEEVDENLDKVRFYLGRIWADIRSGHNYIVKDDAADIRNYAEWAAAEAIQVAAMAQKILDYLEAEGVKP